MIMMCYKKRDKEKKRASTIYDPSPRKPFEERGLVLPALIQGYNPRRLFVHLVTDKKVGHLLNRLTETLINQTDILCIWFLDNE